MRHVEVAADDDGLLRVKRQKIVAERLLPSHAIGEPLKAALRIWRVNCHKVEIVELQRDDASLVIVLFNAEAVADGKRLDAAEDRRARVALLLRTVPILLVARKLQDCLLRLHLRLLHAEDVGVERLERLHEALAEASAQTIDIP